MKNIITIGILIIFISFSYKLTAQMQVGSFIFNEARVGEEFIIQTIDGSKIKDDKYKLIELERGIIIRFEIKDEKLISSFSLSTKLDRLVFEITTNENNVVVESKKYDNWADDSKNVGPLILSSIETLKNNIYCRTVYDDEGNITHKECTENENETYLFQCSTKTKEPENFYCEEFEYKAKTTRFYKNYVLYKEVKHIENEEKGYTLILNFEANDTITKVYEYREYTKTIRMDNSYSIEDKIDYKNSILTEYNAKGKKLSEEKREKSRSFDGITTIKRELKNKTIIETYDNSGVLLNSKEE